jgi:murein DD-endopeptidase MepM/ murein hydrolase activator NlpD
MRFFFIISAFLFGGYSFAQFNSVSKEIRCNEVNLFVAQKQSKDIKSGIDSTLLFSIKKQKEALEVILSKDSIDEQSKNKNPLFCLPLENISINSFYGYRYHPIKKERKFHSGIDLHAKSDTVYAFVGGVVEKAGYSSGLGYYVSIRFNEYEFYYGHLSEYYVMAGEIVEVGQKIGKTGNTGLSTGEHLHFAIKKEDKYINPIVFFQ